MTRPSTDSGKHTPGPWVVKFRNDHSAYISLGNPQSGPHKQFDIDFDDRDPSDVADARLIAAAPELLAQLQLVAFHLRRGDFHARASLADEALDKIELVIAKATGSAA